MSASRCALSSLPVCAVPRPPRRLTQTFLQPEKDLDERIKADQVPLLIVWGERDSILPAVNGRGMAQMRRDAEFICIPGAGHLPHQEKPDLFLDALRPFLKLN